MRSKAMRDNYRGGETKVAFLQLCRSMRKSSTDAESLLWSLLRNRQVAGAKFRRQHQYGPYILDFYSYEAALAIEVDGGQHSLPSHMEQDEARTSYLESAGIRVLRFTSREVLRETDAVAMKIWDEVVRPSPSIPHPNPLPEGEGTANSPPNPAP